MMKVTKKMFKVIMTTGFTSQDMYTGLTEQEATEICESYGWAVRPDGDDGFEWSLDIVEED